MTETETETEGASMDASPTEADSASSDAAHRSRRSLITGAAAALGALAAQAVVLPSPASAAGVTLGGTSNATTTTLIQDTAATAGARAVHGRTTSTSASGTIGVTGESLGSNGVGVYGISNTGGSARGVLGRSTGGTGVRGESTNAYGVYGVSTSGKGVYGEALGNSYGVYGKGGYNGVYGSGGSYGVIGSSSAGYGVYGSGDTGVYGSGGQYGVQAYGSSYGVYASSSAYGIYGLGGPYGVYGAGTTAGVYGFSNSGSGVYGTTSNPNAAAVNGSGGQYGVQGANGGTAGVIGTSGYVGVWGEGTNWGFYSVATGTSGQNYGIMSETMSKTNGFAGLFKGNVQVQGTLSKTAGAFRIDHPRDPDRRWLSHSFVESPDMMNVYNGIATAGAQGTVTVRLPNYFHALNRDFRYQLTAIGGAAPGLHVAREISKGTFRVGGAAPGQRVSWQVTGIRQDDYANAHRIKVDTRKSKVERGTRVFVAKGSGAKQMNLGPDRPKGHQPKPTKVKSAPKPHRVHPRAIDD